MSDDNTGNEWYWILLTALALASLPPILIIGWFVNA